MSENTGENTGSNTGEHGDAAFIISPTNLVVLSVTSSSVTLMWDEPRKGSVVGYNIFSNNPSGGTQIKQASVGYGTNTIALNELLPATDYTFWIKSFNSNTEVSETEYEDASTTAIAPEEAPFLVSMSAQAGSNDVFLDFSKDISTDNNTDSEYEEDLVFSASDGVRVHTLVNGKETSRLIYNLDGNDLFEGEQLELIYTENAVVITDPTEPPVDPTPPPSDGLIVFDSFGTEDYSIAPSTGFRWKGGGNNAPVISNLNPRSGTHSMMITYDGSSPTNGGNTQKNFKLGGNYRELYFNFDWYIPNGNEPWGGARYRRDGTSSKNHKFLRIWCNRDDQSNQDGYRNKDKMGAQNRGEGTFGAEADLNYYKVDNSTGGISETKVGNIVSENDAGKWINIQMHFRQTTGLGHNNGQMRWWKNGVLKRTMSNLAGWDDNSKHLFNEGYIFGAANGGFAEETIMFMDNFTISTKNPL